jgi:hypothetical protein
MLLVKFWTSSLLKPRDSLPVLVFSTSSLLGANRINGLLRVQASPGICVACSDTGRLEPRNCSGASRNTDLSCVPHPLSLPPLTLYHDFIMKEFSEASAPGTLRHAAVLHDEAFMDRGAAVPHEGAGSTSLIPCATHCVWGKAHK